MIIWDDEALILSSSNYSESSLILKVFTKNYGIQKGLVKGAKKRKKSNIYEPGNFVSIYFKARTEDMLGIFLVDLLKPSPLIYLNDIKRFSCIISIINLIEFCLLENEIETELYECSYDLIHIIFSFGESWIQEYIVWEIFLLKKIGFGLELSKCVLSNKTENLKYISPKSGCAVSEIAGMPWKNKLLNLPSFLISKKIATQDELLEGFKITSNFLNKFSSSINKTLPFTRSSFIDNILEDKLN
tara:strand:- start:560 stop:1291 length:732 start_codon:yes stop_codon:yes gene_type:complete